MAAEFAVNFLRFMLMALWLLILGRVLLSWVEPDPRRRSTIGQFLVAATEPILGPIRRVLPQTGMFDLSPLIVILILGTLIRILP